MMLNQKIGQSTQSLMPNRVTLANVTLTDDEVGFGRRESSQERRPVEISADKNDFNMKLWVRWTEPVSKGRRSFLRCWRALCQQSDVSERGWCQFEFDALGTSKNRFEDVESGVELIHDHSFNGKRTQLQ